MNLFQFRFFRMLSFNYNVLMCEGKKKLFTPLLTSLLNSFSKEYYNCHCTHETLATVLKLSAEQIHRSHHYGTFFSQTLCFSNHTCRVSLNNQWENLKEDKAT